MLQRGRQLQKRCNPITIVLQRFQYIRGSIDLTHSKQLIAICSDWVGLFKKIDTGLQDEHGVIYGIVVGTFLAVGLGPEGFASLSLNMIQKYTEQFKWPKLFTSINGLCVRSRGARKPAAHRRDDPGGRLSVMTGEIVNNGRRGEELKKAQDEAHRTMPEKKPPSERD